MDADGTNLRQVTTDPADDQQPAWSPDGKKIAFATERTGNWEVFVMDADGSKVTNLTNHGAFDGGPAWSPDGHKLLFISLRDNGYFLYVMEPTGAGVRQIPAKESGFGMVFPGWSPDGKQIVYTDRIGQDVEIHTCDPEGGSRKKVTTLGGINTFPAWSPDGKQIAFIHYAAEGEKGSLWVTDTEGKSQRQLAEAANFLAGRPAWKPR
jgi:Tol biopolymer transport system component